MSSSIIPGPCPSAGCPPPTEIVCIETTKVYDFCFQVERRDNVCFALPESCHPAAGATISCAITSIDCHEISRAPLTTGGGFYNVTFLLTVTATINIFNPGATDPTCTFTASFSFTKTATLCTPDGTDTTCEVPSFACGPCVITPAHQVCCTFVLCVLLESVATVKLLVPAYGFCVPAECVEVSPEFPECPPTSLFPPQCTPPTR